MWNKLEYVLKDSQKSVCQLEECSDSKGMQSFLNGRTFKYHFWGGRFHMIPQSYKFSYGLCLNSLLKFWLIVNQRDQVSMFIYINRSDEVYHLVIVSKVLGDMKYLIMPVKRAAELVGIWTEENWDVKRVYSLYTMVSWRLNFKMGR